jgi:hypothetical protein
MSPPSSEVPYGALDLMVLKTLDTMGAQHGYGIARRIEQMAEGMLALNQGNDLSRAAAPGAEGMDRERLGPQREQPAGALLLDYPCRTEATRDRSRSLVAHGRDDEQDARGIIVMTLRSILMRISAPLRRRSLDAALDEEVSGHLDLLARDYERRGLAPEQARLAARRDFGGVEQMKETYRDRSGLRWLDDARRDVHHAFRTLRRSPVFAGAAVLTLAIGLIAVTGIYAILNAFVLRAMPVSHPEELVSIGTAPDTHVQIPHGVSFMDLQDYRKDRSAVVDLLGYSVAIGGLNSDNSTERITMYGVTDNYFSLLGVQPAIGRLIQPNEGRARGDAPVIVLTHEYWLADLAAIRRSLAKVRVTGRPFHDHRRHAAIVRQGAHPHLPIGVHPALDVRRRDEPVG